MSSVTYCDRCEVQIKDRLTISYVKVSSIKLGAEPLMTMAEVCASCTKLIADFVRLKVKP